MTLTFQPVRVATGFDEEGMLVLDEEQRLVAVLTHLGEQYDGLSRHWYVEAGFGRLEGTHPTFSDLGSVQEWMSRRLAQFPQGAAA